MGFNTYFFAPGMPKAQPRVRAFSRGGRSRVWVYDPGTAEHWKSQIAIAAKEHLPAFNISGPVGVSLDFRMPYVGKHYRKLKAGDVLIDHPPFWHSVKPDSDNLGKAVLDALTLIGFWHDDSQVCQLNIQKHYTSGQPGVGITIEEDPMPF